MQAKSEIAPWDGLAGDLFRRAFSFGLSAIQLAHVANALAVERNDPDAERSVFNGAHSPAIWILVGFAFELFLKSAIVSKAGESANIKVIGHDLVKAMEIAQEHGLVLLESTRFSIEIANRAHNTKGQNSLFFRYGASASGDVETAEAMQASLADLLGQTAKLVGQPQATFDSFVVPFQG